MIDPRKVSAVIVTKEGPVDPSILASLAGFGEIIVWDNSRRGVDCKVFGRYRAVDLATLSVIYTQDDDCLVDAVRLCAEYEPGKLVCNMKRGHHEAYAGTGIALVGHGSIFDRSLVDFAPYLAKYQADEIFERECDRVFTYLNRDRQKLTEFPIEDLSTASDDSRMWLESRHGRDLAEIRKRLGTL